MSLKILLLSLFSVFFFGCTPKRSYPKIESNGIVIYDQNGTDVQSYFQSHRLMVSQIVRYHPERKKFQLSYPSTNDGPNPKYSHSVEIYVPKGVALTVSDVMESDKFAILHATSNNYVWYLVGTAPIESAVGLFDWFSDKPLYRFSRFNVSSQEHRCYIEKQ